MAIDETPKRPLVAVLDRCAREVHALTDLLESVGFRTRGFTSARAVTEAAPSMAFEVVVAEHATGELSLPQLQARLSVGLGALAPPVVVLTRRLHSMSLTERAAYVAVLSRPVPMDTLLEAIEVGIARRARAAAAH